MPTIYNLMHQLLRPKPCISIRRTVFLSSQRCCDHMANLSGLALPFLLFFFLFSFPFPFFALYLFNVRVHGYLCSVRGWNPYIFFFLLFLPILSEKMVQFLHLHPICIT